MKEIPIVTRKNVNTGDAAVDGLLGGVAAGIAMALVLGILNLLGGEGFAVLTRFDPSGKSPFVGLLMHLAVSGVYGVMFGVGLKLIYRFNFPVWLIGLLYGMALFALAEIVFLPTSHSLLAGIPIEHFGLAHVVYGLVIGWVLSRISKS